VKPNRLNTQEDRQGADRQWADKRQETGGRQAGAIEAAKHLVNIYAADKDHHQKATERRKADS